MFPDQIGIVIARVVETLRVNQRAIRSVEEQIRREATRPDAQHDAVSGGGRDTPHVQFTQGNGPRVDRSVGHCAAFVAG